MEFHLLKGLQNLGNLDLSVILFNEGKLSEEIRKLGVPCDIVDEKKMNSYQMLRITGRIIAKRIPHIIHTHRYKENILALLTRQRETQLVNTQHGMPEYYGKNVNMKHIFLNWINYIVLSRHFRKVIAVSDDIRSLLIKPYGIPEEKVVAIHNGVDTESKPTPKTEGDKFVIGTSGRLFPIKDYPLFVEIAKEILKSADKIRFELAGDGPERSKIEKLVERYGLRDRFLIRGSIVDMAEFYSGLDLYLNTSLHEGIPMSVLEAMAHGLPVVAPDVGGFREISDDGVTGYLIGNRDPKAFARRCLELYRNGDSRQKMAKEARQKVVREFSFERMARDYYQLYLEISDSSHSIRR